MNVVLPDKGAFSPLDVSCSGRPQARRCGVRSFSVARITASTVTETVLSEAGAGDAAEEAILERDAVVVVTVVQIRAFTSPLGFRRRHCRHALIGATAS